MLHKLDNPIEDCNLKFASDDAGTFTGYASVFGSVDSMGDTILRGAFKKTLEERARPVRFLYGHSPSVPLGKWAEMKEDDVGLYVKGEFTPGNSNAQNIRASVKHGALDSLSIGFRIPPGGAEEREDGGRILKAIDLVEISVVVFPAETNAQIDPTSVKSEIEQLITLRDAEQFLRDTGMWSRSMAEQYLGQLKSIILRDAESEAEQNRIQTDMARLIESSKSLNDLVQGGLTHD